MAKQPDEQIVKSRARRRLIGAIAIALAVVVILPMVLDSEPRITGQDIDLRIPASDKAGDFVPGVALSEVLEAASQAESAVSPQAESAVNPQAASEVPVVAKAAASGKITVAEAKPEGLNQAAISAVQAEVRKTEDRPVEAKPAEAKKPEAKKTEVKSVEAKKPEARPAETRQAEQAAGTYIVQVGAFSNAGTAALEAEKLKAWGFKAYVQLISGTNRVRVGPYADRNKADEVRRLLEKHGLQPVITAVK